MACRLGWAAVLAAPVVRAEVSGEPAPPVIELRLWGPAAVEARGSALFRLEMRRPGAAAWERVPEDALSARVSGQALLVEDPSARPVNPFQVSALGVSTGEAVVTASAYGKGTEMRVRVGPVGPFSVFSAQIRADRPLHRYAGLGAGVMSNDDQWDITTTHDLYDWCFRDVRAQFVRVLLRPDYEPENDNRDPGRLREEAFDFARLERPIRILRAALERDPGLKVYAQLGSPPAWLKDRGDLSGRAGLRPDRAAAAEMAEYVFAALRHLRRRGVEAQYLSLFQEPDWPREEAGLHVPDLGRLADLLGDCAAALDALAAGDGELRTLPALVFPDARGPGSITGAGPQADLLKSRADRLARVGVWGVHDYGDLADRRPGRFERLRAFPPVAGKPVWVTEWAPPPGLGDGASGAACGQEMLNALRLGAGAWMAAEWCHPAARATGLVPCDWNARKPRPRFWRSRAYHVFRQIANATPAGGEVLHMEARLEAPEAGPDAVEYLAVRSAGSIVCHLQSAHPSPLGFRVFWPRGAAEGAVEGWVTDLARDGAGLPPGAVEVSPPVRGYAAASGLLPAHGLVTLKLPAGP